MNNLYRFLRCATLMVLMMAWLMPAKAQQQTQITLTTANDVTNHTETLYWIESYGATGFYMIPHTNNSNVSTTNMPNLKALWYFMDAGSENNTQYYYIVNHNTGYYLKLDGTLGSENTIKIADFGSGGDAYKFSIGGSEGQWILYPKSGNGDYWVNKRGGNVSYSLYLKSSNYNGSPDANSKWNFVAKNSVTWAHPFTNSINENKHYYNIHNATANGSAYYISTDDDSDPYATVSNVENNKRIWYFMEADEDNTIPNLKYYYIVNAVTGKYLKFTGTANGSLQAGSLRLYEHDGTETGDTEDRFRFMVLNAIGSYTTPAYSIMPKLEISYYYNKNASLSPGDANGNAYSGDNAITLANDMKIGIYNDRGQERNYAHWLFVETNYVPAAVETPTITNNFDGTISISTTTAGATIYYTTNGDTPDNTSTKYTAPFALGDATVIKAIAYLGSEHSDVTPPYNVPEYTKPTISFDNSTSQVTITCAGATGIYYTTNGSTPTISSTSYSTPFTVSSPTTVKAIATHPGYLNSMETATINQVAAPGFAPTFDGKVRLTCTTNDVDFYYEMGANPNDPTTSSTHYTGPIENAAGQYIKAIAVKDGMINSDPATSELISFPCAMPVISKTSATTFTIECSYPTSGVTIYYNTGDGNQADPTNASEEYHGEVTFNESALPFTVKAIAYADNYEPSSVAILTITQEHDYSKDYLTFRILSDGVVTWKALGTGSDKTIEYSINDGNWTSITSTSAGVDIPVVTNDVVRFRGNNTKYCANNKNNYSGFENTSDSAAEFNIEGNIMSLVYGDNYINNSTLTETWVFCSLFKKCKVISAENLILPALTLTEGCYRALFSYAQSLTIAPKLPATTLAIDCYWYMFEKCAITTAPELLATTLLKESYGYMFNGCASLNYIKCLATNISATDCLKGWTTNVAPSGTFVKDASTSWSTGTSGIPSGWVPTNQPAAPFITCDGDYITITCQTDGASIYYRLGQTDSYSLYSAPVPIHKHTVVEAYSEKDGAQSNTVSEYCIKSIRFAGMEMTSGPLYYGSNGYEIKEDWNVVSYQSIYGKRVGSTYFNFIELGQLFESSVFSTSDGDIEKVLDPLDDRRVPTNAEWASIIGTTRSGSTVNGASNKHYAMIELADVSGLLIFPDGVTITGVALSNMDNTTSNTGITASQLNDYLEQGCIFLPSGGYYDDSWGNGHYYWSSTENNSSTGYVSSGDNKDKENCYFPVYLVKNTADEATRLLRTWTYNGNEVELPYSINAIDGHSASYAKGTFNFTTDVKIKELQPTYLWFQHADQSAAVYVDNTLVEKHWGGYNAFFVDITDHVHLGTNNIKVAIKNNEGNYLAPCAGDFNFNATLGEVKLISSPVVPSPDYGYDGFHITSTVSAQEATITVKTSVPTDATLTCSIKGTNCDYSSTQTGEGEITFTTTITNPHLWNGTLDPYLYDVTLTIAKDGVVYHKFKRGYGLRFFEYAVDNEHPENSRFLLNGSPYLLRGVCMHSDLEGKANALTAADIDNDFEILKELGCNFVRLAHYPHPKEVYDWCDKLGIIVQTEAPWVNNAQSTQPSDYYTHLEGQYEDMVNQHYNHPSIIFWGLSNETTTDDKDFVKEKINGYISLIKNLDSSRLVGYVMSHSVENPSGYYNDPDADWFGCNIYVGWYIDKNSNNPTSRLDTRLTKTLSRLGKPLAFSEYGCGGTPSCHSDDFMTTTTTGNNPRHDIEYQMWLHEGHIAAIKNFPQLLFTSQWQLFDIAVYNRVEGYKVCPDGETVFENNELQRLNNKGLVERDHKTKKDTYYLYKAWWNQDDKFVHICGKDYEKLTSRVIKCYTNDGGTLTLYVNDNEIETVTVTNNIATFTARNFSQGDVIRVNGATSNDTFTFIFSDFNVFTTEGDWNEASNWSAGAVPTTGSDVAIVANATVPSEYTANAGNITLYGSTLTISDSGQLVCNSAVNATVEKNITAYTVSQNQDESLTNGWYFIASPITDGYTPTGSMVANTYDLYRLNNTTWENFKNTTGNPDFTTLENGTGYLYANSGNNNQGVTLTFTGHTKPYDANYGITLFEGFNLVGNPYTFDAYVNRPYYKINAARNALEAVSDNAAIAPCTGVVVDYTDGQSAVFTQTPAQSQSSNGGLNITVTQQVVTRGGSNTETLDNAIVSFNEDSQLGKFYFGTQNANIYILQNGKEFAIVSAEAQGEMPVNFEARENGTYTLTVDAENVEMGYLHLIDNMTGADIDLLRTPSYTFNALNDDYASRFRLVFSANMNENDNENFAFFSNGNWIIANEGEATLQVIDINGRIISNETINGTFSKRLNVANGVYVLRLVNSDNVKTQKIMIR